MKKHLLTLLVGMSTVAFAQTEDYPVNFAKNATNTSNYSLTTIAVNSPKNGTSRINLVTEDAKLLYRDYSQHYDKQLSVSPGDALLFTPTFTGTTDLSGYLYIDLNQDGQFTPLFTADGNLDPKSELVAFNSLNGKNSVNVASEATLGTMPKYTLADNLPHGVYRGRLVLDKNSAQPGGSSDLLTNGGQVVDFLINVHGETTRVDVDAKHGYVVGTTAALPLAVPAMKALVIRMQPVASGYYRSHFTIRHGHHLDGPQFVHGNRQWGEETPNISASALAYNIPATYTDANVKIKVNYEPGATATLLPVLSEEFDQADGEQPDAKLWHRSTRYPRVTWARYISNSPDVVFVNNGELVCRAIATPASEKANGETAEMISGSVESSGLFDFQYGKIEARIRTNAHSGNFPAFWLMPAYTPDRKGWPHEGEIDIWEHINSENRSYHTVHSNWTYNLGRKNDPLSHGTKENLDPNTYHIFGVEWTPTTIKWYVDGRLVFTYAKSTNTNALNEGQWPFDRKFYIILNQSCGDGSWAARPDLSYTYETRFDWVRVYQTKEQNPLANILAVSEELSTPSLKIYGLDGRQVKSPSKGLHIVGKEKRFF